MMSRQFSFSKGELARAVYGRVDTVAYQTGLRTCRNMQVARYGGVFNRPGLAFVDETRYPAKKSRLIPFIFSVADGNTYAIEMGELYFEFLQNGARIVEASQAITAITKANPAVVTYVGADPSNGDDVVITGGDMPEIKNRRFRIKNVNAGANTFELTYTDNSNVNSTGFTTYTGGGVFSRIYKVDGGFLESELPTVQFAQSGDVITFAIKSVSPQQLSRFGVTNWTYGMMKFCGSIPRPASITLAMGGAGAILQGYKVAAIGANGEETLPAYTGATPLNITGATQTNPVQLTVVGHGLTTGDQVYVYGVGGMTELNGHDLNQNGRDYTVTVINANTISLVGEDGTSYAAYAGPSGTLVKTFVRTAGAAPTVAAPNVISWTAVATALYYNVYKDSNGVYSRIGTTAGVTFNDTGQTPDSGKTPLEPNKLFLFLQDAPAAVTIAKQRLWFGGSDRDPTKIWGSQIRYFNNFYAHLSPIDSDALTIDMAGPQVNRIKHLLELAKLLVFSASSEKSVNGSSDGVITPSSPVLKSESYNGAADVPPVIADNNVIFVQRDQSVLRDQAFDWQVDGYRGNDLTIFSSHLLEGYTIREMAFQKSPNPTIWVVRSDGVLLGLTYLREQQLLGWHRHDTDGLFESVCCVPEGTEDAVYFVVKRTVNGATKRYVERMSSRLYTDIKDAKFLDSFLTYDGRNTNASKTMTLTGGTTWDSTETLTCTASAATFAAADVGKEVHLTGADGKILRFRILAFTNSTVVTGKATKTVPTSLRGVATATWGIAVKTVSGLWHLEGKTISAIGDGFVLASRYNPGYAAKVVSNGSVTFDKCHQVIHAGLAYLPDTELLDMDTLQGESLIGKGKEITSVTLFVEKSRGIWTGPKPPTNDAVDATEGLTEAKCRSDEDQESPVNLKTDSVDVPINGEWNTNGRVFIRQIDPLPLHILAVAPTGDLANYGG